MIDRGPTQGRYVYYFNRDGEICGKLFDALRNERGPDRFDEFESWARVNRPGELAHLMPDGEIIPDVERAERWRVLLAEWREAVRLPAVVIPD